MFPKKSAVKKRLGFIQLLLGVPASKRSKILLQCGKPEINAICEIVSNFLKGNLTTDPKIIKKFKSCKCMLRTLILKKTSLKHKKKIISSKRGAGLITALLPLVAGLFSLLRK